jgi:hypothetical protein
VFGQPDKALQHQWKNPRGGCIWQIRTNNQNIVATYINVWIMLNPGRLHFAYSAKPMGNFGFCYSLALSSFRIFFGELHAFAKLPYAERHEQSHHEPRAIRGTRELRCKSTIVASQVNSA